MTTVGKKFPDLTVNAMNEMGDTFPLNVLEKAVSEKKKNSALLVPKGLYFCLSDGVACFSRSFG